MNNREAFEAQRVLINLFERWKGYELPDLNSDNQFDKEWLHREWVAFQAGYQAALASQAQQTESQWISVDERLPEENTYVLCSYKRFGEWLVHEGRYNEKGDFTITIIDEKVRYWMPLPPAPEGDK